MVTYQNSLIVIVTDVLNFVDETSITMYFSNVRDCCHASLLRFELYVPRK